MHRIWKRDGRRRLKNATPFGRPRDSRCKAWEVTHQEQAHRADEEVRKHLAYRLCAERDASKRATARDGLGGGARGAGRLCNEIPPRAGNGDACQAHCGSGAPAKEAPAQPVLRMCPP